MPTANNEMTGGGDAKNPRPKFTTESKSKWRYAVAVARFFMVFLDTGICKSFGVLLNEMVLRYDTNYTTMAFICNIPSFIMYFSAPLVQLLTRRWEARTLAVSGGLLTGLSLICTPYSPNLIFVAMLFTLAGFGMSLTLFPIYVVMDEFLCESFIFWVSWSNFGDGAGALTLPLVVERSLEAYGFHGAFLIMGGLALNGAVCGATVKSRHSVENVSSRSDASVLQESTRVSGKSNVNVSSVISSHREHDACPGHPFEESLESVRPEDTDREKTIKDGNDIPREGGARDPDGIEMGRSSLPALSDSGLGRTPSQSLSKMRDFVKSSILFEEPAFISMVPSIYMFSHAYYAWLIFLVPHAEWLGIPPLRAVLLSTIAGATGILGRLVFLTVHRCRVKTSVSCSVVCAIATIVFFLDPCGRSYVFLAATTTVQAFCIFFADVIGWLPAKEALKDKDNFGTATSITMVTHSIGAITGGMVSGKIFDISGSYSVVFLQFGLVFFCY